MEQEVEPGGLAVAGPFLFAVLAYFPIQNGDRRTEMPNLPLQPIQNQSDAGPTNDTPATPVK
jgi:hypothetical protein